MSPKFAEQRKMLIGDEKREFEKKVRTYELKIANTKGKKSGGKCSGTVQATIKAERTAKEI